MMLSVRQSRHAQEKRAQVGRSQDRRAQAGQALTEFVVVGSLVLVPLFLIVPVVAKVISQKQDVELAARYAAWERTVWYADAGSVSGLDPNKYDGPALTYKSDAEVATEIDARIFAAGETPINSSGSDGDVRLDPFSRRPNGDLAPLIAQNGAGYAGSTSSNSAPDGAGRLMKEVSDIVSKVSRFDMPDNGLVDSQVNVNLADMSDVFGDGLAVDALTLSANNAIYTESWAAGSREHAEDRIQGLVPQQYLDNKIFDSIQDLVSLIPFAKEIDSDCLILSHTTIEPLPGHRLESFDGVKGGGGTSCDL